MNDFFALLIAFIGNQISLENDINPFIGLNQLQKLY